MKSYVTFFNEMQNAELKTATSLLADKYFQHWIIFTDNIIIFTAPEPYSYSIPTDSRYNNSEFKSLLVDSGTAICFTGCIGQFKAL